MTDTDITALIGRLRTYGPHWPISSMIEDAADALEILQAKMEQMRADCEKELRDAYADYCEDAEALQARYDEAVAELTIANDRADRSVDRAEKAEAALAAEKAKKPTIRHVERQPLVIPDD